MKKRIKAFLNDNKWIMLGFLLSSIIIIVIYSLQKIAPFGNNSMLDVDFYHQYGPLLNELYDRIKQGESLLYSFNTAGGIAFYRNFLNYLSSPFNLVLLLFKKENIVMAFSVIIALKVVVAQISMSCYLKNTFKKNSILIAFFGCLYSFSGYFCAYYWNIMWLDGMVFLPIIMIGINKIINENKASLYIISLAVMLFANYFIGYMICIFSVVYFIGLLIYKGNFKIKNILKKCSTFLFSSVLAGMLVAFLLLPLYASLNSISATKDVMPSLSTNFSISNYVFNHLTGVKRTVFSSDILPLPNVYPGMLTLVLILILFINKKINIKFKVLSILALLFFFFSFNINTIDFIWHAFHVPNDLPWRYSFIYVFVLISLGYYSILRIKDVSIIRISICFLVAILVTLLSNKLDFKNMTDKKAIICLGLLILYYAIIILYKNKSVNKKFLYAIFSLLILFECVYSIDVNWDIDHDIKNFMQDKKPYMSLIKKARQEDNGLYRIEKTDYLTLNDGAWYDYYGISTFSSMAYESMSKTQRMLGLAGNNINSFYYKEYQTPIYNTMFNIKYIMGKYVNNDYYKVIGANDNNVISRYDYSTSIAYAVNKDIKNWHLVNYNPFLNQSEFVLKSSLIKDIFEKVDIKEVGDNAKITNVSDDAFDLNLNYEIYDASGELTLVLDNKKHDNIYLYIGSDGVSSFEIEGSYYTLTSDEYYVFDAGKINSDYVNVKINFNDNANNNLLFGAYTINEDAFNKFYNAINDETLKVEKYSDTYIYGKINAKDDEILFTTIAYDKGWSVYVDGKKVKTKDINSFLTCNLKKGTHKIKMVYYPYLMKEGLIISAISLVFFAAYYMFFETKIKKKNKKDKFIV